MSALRACLRLTAQRESKEDVNSLNYQVMVVTLHRMHTLRLPHPQLYSLFKLSLPPLPPHSLPLHLHPPHSLSYPPSFLTSSPSNYMYMPFCIPLNHLQRSYSEAISGMTEGSSQRDRGTSLGRDDRIHGSLLIINELIMNSAWSDEVRMYTVYTWQCFLVKRANPVPLGREKY